MLRNGLRRLDHFFLHKGSRSMLTQFFLKVAFVGSEWVLWVLLVVNFISVATIVDRILYLRRTKVDGDALGAQLDQLLRAGDLRGGVERWWPIAKPSSVSWWPPAWPPSRGSQACCEAMLSAKARVKPLLEARLNILGTIGSNAPYIGLLGTVLGIIKAAHDLSGKDPSQVMGGVFEALIATAFGLFVAIPAVIAFNIFQRKVRETLAKPIRWRIRCWPASVTTRSRPARAGQPVRHRSHHPDTKLGFA